MHIQILSAATALLVLASTTAQAVPGTADVVCKSSTNVKEACEGVMKVLDKQAFLTRWPSGFAIWVTTQHVRTVSAALSVTTGTLAVVRVVHSNTGDWGVHPAYFVQASNDTDNLSDGAADGPAQANIGYSLGKALNKELASGRMGKPGDD